MIGLNQDLLVILLIVALIFGAKKLPEIGKGPGKGIQEFKQGLSGQGDEESPTKPKGDEGKGSKPEDCQR